MELHNLLPYGRDLILSGARQALESKVRIVQFDFQDDPGGRERKGTVQWHGVPACFACSHLFVFGRIAMC